MFLWMVHTLRQPVLYISRESNSKSEDFIKQFLIAMCAKRVIEPAGGWQKVTKSDTFRMIPAPSPRVPDFTELDSIWHFWCFFRASAFTLSVHWTRNFTKLHRIAHSRALFLKTYPHREILNFTYYLPSLGACGCKITKNNERFQVRPDPRVVLRHSGPNKT